MKTFLKTLVARVLAWEAALVLKRHKPIVVGVTGSVGKTSTKEAIAAVLAKRFTVRTSPKSFNSELGVPLTILGQDTAWGSAIGWLGVLWRGLIVALFSRSYATAVVLEMGVDHPGDMRALARWVRLDVAVVTHIGEVPVHVEAFDSPKALADEKMLILSAVKPDGAVILTHDDAVVMGYKERIKQRVFTFGVSEGATVKGGYYATTYDTYGAPTGFAAKILIESNAFPFSYKNVIGRQFVYPALAAAAVGVALDINMVDVLSALESVKPAPGRMRLLPGIRETLLIDDTYNSSPVAAREALATLADMSVRGRKIAMLGSMRELGELSKRAHRDIGAQAASIVDILVAVGDEAQEMIVGATGAGAKDVHSFTTAEEALTWAHGNIRTGDTVLIKGSQSIRLEKVVKGLLADTRDVKKLVRQDKAWEAR